MSLRIAPRSPRHQPRVFAESTIFNASANFVKNVQRFLTERNHDLFRLAMMQLCAQQKKQLCSCSFEYRCSGESATEDAWPAAQFANSPYYRF
jgi:hypothetical protein